MFTMNLWLTMPVLWFVGIGLDIILHVVPSTIVWPFEYIPRHTHFTEGEKRRGEKKKKKKKRVQI